MFAVLVEVDTGGIADMDAARKHLNQTVVPQVRDAGARAAYWLESRGSRGVSMFVFDTEEVARAMAGGLKVGETPAGAPEGVKVRTVEVSEVVASL
jgi:hypothetical protein